MTYSYIATATDLKAHHREIEHSPYGVSVQFRGMTLVKHARSMRLAQVSLKSHISYVAELMETADPLITFVINAVPAKPLSATKILIAGFIKHAVDMQLSIPFIFNLFNLYTQHDGSLPYPCQMTSDFYMVVHQPRNCGKTQTNMVFNAPRIAFNQLLTLTKMFGNQLVKSSHRKMENMMSLDRWLKRYRTHETCLRTKAFIDEMLMSTIWASDIKSGKFLVPEHDVQSEYVLSHSTTLLSGHTVDHYVQPVVLSKGVPCEDKTGDYTVSERSARGIVVWPSHDNEGNSLGETFPIPPNIKV